MKREREREQQSAKGRISQSPDAGLVIKGPSLCPLLNSPPHCTVLLGFFPNHLCGRERELRPFPPADIPLWPTERVFPSYTRTAGRPLFQHPIIHGQREKKPQEGEKGGSKNTLPLWWDCSRTCVCLVVPNQHKIRIIFFLRTHMVRMYDDVP